MKKLLAIVLCLLLLAGCAETYDGPTELKSVLASTEESCYDDESSIYEYLRTKYSYDVHGRLAVAVTFRNDEPSLRTVYRYYEDGSRKSETQYDLTGWFPWPTLHAKYTYDDQGRQTSLVQWNGLDKTEQTTTYDDEDRTVTTEFTGGRTVLLLDEEGRPLRSETVFDDGNTELRENTYQDRVTISRFYRNGELNTVWEYTCDDQGRDLEWYETRDGERKLIWRYEYDKGHDICHYESIGRTIITGYNEDGTVKAIWEEDETGGRTRRVIYRYTEIRVPAEEGATP